MSRWQQIGRRDWAVIREVWLNHIPPIPAQGARPNLLVDHLLLAGLRAQQIAVGSLSVYPDSICEAVLWEAVFLMHKAGHLLGGAQVHLSAGRISWSLFSAYHSALLSLRAVAAFLGVTFPRPDGATLILDLYPVQEAKRRNPRSRLRVPELFLLKPGGRIEQRQFWEIALRTIRMTQCIAWNAEVVSQLSSLSAEEITRKRNPFIYSPPYWPLDDLLQPQDPSQFLVRKQKFPEGALDESTDQFLWSTALFAFHAGIELLRDLATEVPLLANEFAAFRGGYWPAAAISYETFFAPI